MSISRHVDLYLADRGIEQNDEVVPESECQVFDGQVANTPENLEQLREFVAALLN